MTHAECIAPIRSALWDESPLRHSALEVCAEDALTLAYPDGATRVCGGACGNALALRRPDDVREAFLKQYKTTPCKQHGIVQKEYAYQLTARAADAAGNTTTSGYSRCCVQGDGGITFIAFISSAIRVTASR
jgi:hypothetical protein